MQSSFGTGKGGSDRALHDGRNAIYLIHLNTLPGFVHWSVTAAMCLKVLGCIFGIPRDVCTLAAALSVKSPFAALTSEIVGQWLGFPVLRGFLKYDLVPTYPSMVYPPLSVPPTLALPPWWLLPYPPLLPMLATQTLLGSPQIYLLYRLPRYKALSYIVHLLST